MANELREGRKRRLWMRLVALILVIALVLSMLGFDFSSMRFVTKAEHFADAYTALISAMDSGDYDKSEEYIELCLKYKSGSADERELADVYYRCGMIKLLIKEDNEAAIEALTMAIETDDTYAEPYLLRAQAKINMEDSGAAAADVETYTALSGDSSGYEALGAIYETLGDWSHAAEAYEKANKTSAAVYIRAVEAEEAGRTQEAAEGFEEAAKDSDYTSAAAFNAGLCRTKLEEYRKAEKDFTLSINTDTLVDGVYFNRAVCRMQLGSFEKAMEDLEISMDKESYADDALSNYVLCAVTLEEYEKALEILNSSLGDDPEGSQNVYYRAVCETQLEQWEAAEADFTRCINANVMTDESTYNRALVYCALESYDEAITDLTACIDKGYETDACHYQRALVYAVLGDEEACNADIAVLPEGYTID